MSSIPPITPAATTRTTSPPSKEGTITTAKGEGDPAVILISCYELGRQPLSIAVPLAHLHAAGVSARPVDLAQEKLTPGALGEPRLIAIATPMHTALRLGVAAARRLRAAHPRASICFFGLYAGLNASYLFTEELADTVITGEVEEPLTRLAEALLAGDGSTGLPGVLTPGAETPASLRRPRRWHIPRRQELPPLDRYVHLRHGPRLTPAAAVEASRGCLHVCRHCPLTPVYKGRFLAIPVETVLQDVAAVVAAGAGHISFADPDFLNGPTHALRVTQAVHARFPDLTLDFTAKVEHLVRHADLLPRLAECGALFVVSAVESLNNRVLIHLDKGHDRADVGRALAAVRRAGMVLRPTLIPFTPWSTATDYQDLLCWLGDEDLAEAVDPVQMSIRLLVPPGSPLATFPAMTPFLNGLAADDFAWRWRHPDARMDRLQKRVSEVVAAAAEGDDSPRQVHRRIARAAAEILGQGRTAAALAGLAEPPRHQDGWPRLTEPWFC